MTTLIIKCASLKERDELKEMFHESFKGWDAYVDNSVAICNDYDEVTDKNGETKRVENNTFFVVIGPDNGNNITLHITAKGILASIKRS